ncbi:phosphate ABC transporter permease PstA [Ferrigenium sp. UT5]|uniref:phosphate ABC transporter permease PstA n=1 Tax=Ferrigenium sp. UT5 TaxID=3242105 RepID=UPI003550E9BD
MTRRIALADSLLTVAVWGAMVLLAGVFCWMLADIVWHGIGKLDWEFLTAEPMDAGRAGGILPILVATLLILLVALGVAVPLGLGAAIYLSEFTRSQSRFRRFVNISLDALSGVPSIVFGLFGNAFFCIWLGLGFSILSGGLTLACMVLPIFIRLSESGLSAVAVEWRQGASALGLSRSTTLWHLLLPAAAPAISAGLMLGIGRALAETAALIFTSGYVDRMPEALSDSGRALSVHIYDLSMNVSGGDQAAYASALVLMVALLIINGASTTLSRHFLHNRIQLS